MEKEIEENLEKRKIEDMGERVIKVERNGVGDLEREYDDRVNGME